MSEALKCTGVKFRARVSNYFNKKRMSFEHKESLTLLKRESCKCNECSHAIADIEQAGQDLIDSVYWRIFSSTEDNEMKDGSTFSASFSWDSGEGYGCFIQEINFKQERES